MKGRYSTAKSFSKITIALLLFAVLFFAFLFVIGLSGGAYLLPVLLGYDGQ